MRIKKYLFLALIAVLVSGCSKEYNLTINDNKFIEEVNVTLKNNIENRKIVEQNYYPLHANTKDTYERKIDNKDGYLNLNLKYRYNEAEFANANSINQCFKERKLILDNEEYYYIELRGMNNCVSDFNFDINIITNNKVISSNADSINKSKYTWHVNENNKDNFNLKIKIAKNEKNKTGILNSKILTPIILGVMGIALIIFISVVIKSIKNKNKI